MIHDHDAMIHVGHEEESRFRLHFTGIDDGINTIAFDDTAICN
jgi:hypothetical protein